MVNLRYECGNEYGGTYQFQATRFVKTRSANFHEYSWNPDVFQFDYGAEVKRFLKDPITYSATLDVRGSADQRKRWLSDFHNWCDFDIRQKTPGKLYWGDMYIECYIISTSTEPNEGNVTTSNEIGIYCPYPSWVYPITYAYDQTFSETDVQNILSRVGDVGYVDIYSDISHLNVPFVPLSLNFRAVYVGDGTSTTPFIRINGSTSITTINFPNLTLTASEALVVDSRAGRKTAYVSPINGSPPHISSTGTNVYNLREANTRPFRQFFPFLSYTAGGYRTGYFLLLNGASRTILTVFLERSEPAWIS